ncbi:CRISPR-associated endonuclease Cas2 [Neolewinella lacunae]|uniref:CRISPR-associated endoribonuclease Cas2 n=1 Tax=Neolewinella lacunae TaxID=1517758 RepID=A0A923PPL5_9BACT|nr:CRISPR-associated endonuclease Cas2 [Neolewinella lacunae]MBC6995149.1 CRISPR-associated endonuclease Cas2 [Neolewinella lacunae]MDN3634099.1 CRISPR-associated endonuclease Cas2 [Neolewinella lacunae]
MYVIAVYDVAAERTGKMLRLCRQHLHWIQNSVFEGELTAVGLRELEIEAEKIMDLSYDSLIIFTNTHVHRVERRIIGREKQEIDQFL